MEILLYLFEYKVMFSPNFERSNMEVCFEFEWEMFSAFKNFGLGDDANMMYMLTFALWLLCKLKM
jgi:hypothetical protein